MSDRTTDSSPGDPASLVDVRPSSEDTLKLVTAFLRVKDRQKRAEIIALAELSADED